MSKKFFSLIISITFVVYSVQTASVPVDEDWSDEDNMNSIDDFSDTDKINHLWKRILLTEGDKSHLESTISKRDNYGCDTPKWIPAQSCGPNGKCCDAHDAC